jgi:hypothetical protein
MTKRFAAFCAASLSFVVFLVVAMWGSTFGIGGQTSRSLLPGTSATINVRISNPHFYPIVISDLTVRVASVTPAHKGETCRPSNFTIRQAKDFRVVLDANTTVTLSSKTISPSRLPDLQLTRDRSKLDDGCQGATVNLAYAASGNWWTR